MYILYTLVILFRIINAYDVRIPQIARKCTLLIHMPSEINTFEMLERTLQANCYGYYNVAIDPHTKNKLSTSYNNVILADSIYQKVYIENDHLLYRIKTWLHTDAWDPFSIIQKQMKECNAQLIGSSFNGDDIHNTIPIFKGGLQYMNECFQDVYADTEKIRERLEDSYEHYTSLAQNSTKLLQIKYTALNNAKKNLTSTIGDFETNIIDVHAKIYGSS